MERWSNSCLEALSGYFDRDQLYRTRWSLLDAPAHAFYSAITVVSKTHGSWPANESQMKNLSHAAFSASRASSAIMGSATSVRMTTLYCMICSFQGIWSVLAVAMRQHDY